MLDITDTFSYIGSYDVSGGVSTAGHCGGGGTAHQTTYINGIAITRFYTDNSDMPDECIDTTTTYFAEGDSHESTFKQFYVGRASTLLIYGTDVKVTTNDLDCDSATANMEEEKLRVTFTDIDALKTKNLAQTIHLIFQFSNEFGVRILVYHCLAYNLLGAVCVPATMTSQIV